MVARSSVNAKIDQVKASVATKITINPAGVQGGFGGGNPLTADQLQKIKNTSHITSTVSTLTDQLGSSDTNLTPSFELGAIGQRFMRFESSEGSGQNAANPSGAPSTFKAPTPRTTITGTNDPTSVVPSGKLTSGSMIDGSSSNLVALVGKALAGKNNLRVGDTFTAYGKTVTISGIFSVDNKFENNGIIMPIAAVQTLTNQAGDATSVVATVDSSDNVAGAVSALKGTLGDAADITSQEDQATQSVQPLESIANLATAGVVGASIASAVIILLSMIMIVRERRREIGVIKAIGGTNAKVIVQFVTEALTLTVIGGILGLALGILTSGPLTESLVSNSDTTTTGQLTNGSTPARTMMRASGFRAFGNQLNTNVKSITSTLTPQVFAQSVGIILLIAILGSAVPAWIIARIRPAEVLRTE